MNWLLCAKTPNIKPHTVYECVRWLERNHSTWLLSFPSLTLQRSCCIQFDSNARTVKPFWKGQECLSKVAKFGSFPCTILYKPCLFDSSRQATSFERPLSWVAFIEGFHCIYHCRNRVQYVTVTTRSFSCRIIWIMIIMHPLLAPDGDVGCVVRFMCVEPKSFLCYV